MNSNKPLARIALTHLVAKKRQTIVATLGVMFGIAIFIFQAGLITGFQTTFIDKTINTTANIRIHNEADKNRKSIAGKLHDPRKDWVVVRNQKPREDDLKIRNGNEIVKIIERHPDVAGVSPFLASQVIFKMGIAQQAGFVSGVLIEKEDLLFGLSANMKEGNTTRLLTIPNGIILGAGLAEKLGAKMEDLLSIISPMGVTLEMKVVGINESGLTEVDKTRAFVNLRNAQKLLQVDGSYITDINIKLKNIDRAGELASEFEKRFGYKADDWKTANANIFGVFKLQNMVTSLVIASIMIVSGFGIFNILMMIIYEKMPDIAILKAVGFRNGDIKKIFLMESLIIGLFGGILGMGFGFIITHIVGSIPMNIKGFVSMKYLYFNQSPAFYVTAFLFALLVTGIAGYLPARKAAKIDPMDIIRSK